jgi:hypothetical protein
MYIYPRTNYRLNDLNLAAVYDLSLSIRSNK